MNTCDLLPTGTFETQTQAGLRDSLVEALEKDEGAGDLTLLFYAITLSGWEEIEHAVTAWKDSGERSVSVIVGTDDGITEPEVLEKFMSLGVILRVMTQYTGLYHPKVVWLKKSESHLVWVGSNNLTRRGLLDNVECATVLATESVKSEFLVWYENLRASSVVADAPLITSYRLERQRFRVQQQSAGIRRFNWSRRKSAAPDVLPGSPGDLVIEIMPRETGSEGRQVQIPKAAATTWFGLGTGGQTQEVLLRHRGLSVVKTLTLTEFNNNTIRLTLNALEWDDRPCVVVFSRPNAEEIYEYEVVTERDQPARYSILLTKCIKQSREGSRRWGVL